MNKIDKHKPRALNPHIVARVALNMTEVFSHPEYELQYTYFLVLPGNAWLRSIQPVLVSTQM